MFLYLLYEKNGVKVSKNLEYKSKNNFIELSK